MRRHLAPTRGITRALVTFAGAALLLHAGAATVAAQDIGLPRPHLEWRTTESEHFVFHYPESMREWTLAVAPRMDAIHGAVRAFVGYAPPGKVDIVVDDPANESNGSAWPVVGASSIYLWPTPPEPVSAIGNNRSWGEILGVHEFAHVAHLSRPPRRPLWRVLTPFGWIGLSPVAVKSPRWMTEGYATFVEGRLTGHGRPRGVWRPAILRQFAREGRLPTYGGLNSTDGFYQGSLAYLAGSAFIEWLAEQRGDSSLVHVWRRLTARTERSFDEAFAGVYGAPPARLYGRFTAELTAAAMAAEERLGGADSAAAGTTVQRHQWYTGEPALSPDGTMMAYQVGDRELPTRVMIYRTTPDTVTDRERERRRRALERDPEDVAAIEVGPRPRERVATLWPHRGSAFSRPRWFRDGERLLLVHRDALGDGALRTDLWEWNRKSGDLRRITHGAGIRSGDPSPDGTQAAVVQCLDGRCDLALVNVATGAIRTLAAGSPTVTWYRPRWSPDGRTIAAAVQRDGLWRVATVDATSGAVTELFPEETRINRYDAAWTPDGRALVMVSEATGIPQLVRVDLATRAVTPLTQVFGAAFGPDVEPSGRAVYFNSLYARGMDIKRIVPESTTVTVTAALDTALSPAVATFITRADTFAVGPLSAERGYGTGPRRHLLLPWAMGAIEGTVYGLSIAGTDPVGRLTWTLSGGWGLDYDVDATGWRRVVNRLYASEGMWRGGSLRAEWRGTRPVIEGEAWWTEHRPGRQRIGRPFLTQPLSFLDHEQLGARIGATLVRDFAWRSHTYRAGLVYSTWEPQDAALEAEDETRRLGYAELGGAYRFARKRNYVGASWRAQGATGTTLDVDWNRVLVSAGLSAGGSGGSIKLDAMYGRTSGDNPLEQFAVGGVPTPFFDQSVMSQRIVVPGLPVGILGGERLATWRVSLGGDLLEPYYMGIAAGAELPDLGDLHRDAFRLVGAESRVRTPNIPLVRAPGAELLLGTAYLLDEPLKERWTFYAGVSFRP